MNPQQPDRQPRNHPWPFNRWHDTPDRGKALRARIHQIREEVNTLTDGERVLDRLMTGCARPVELASDLNLRTATLLEILGHLEQAKVVRFVLPRTSQHGFYKITAQGKVAAKVAAP